MLRRDLLLCTCASLIAGSARATTTLSPPKGKVLLTVTGKITVRNSPDAALFDLDMLDALPSGQFKGETPWTKGVVTFVGPLGSALLDAVGATGTRMKVSALNDYVTEIPISDFRTHQVILATHRDGKTMPVRDLGPIFIIYPMDKEPDLRNELVYNRSAWQVKTIDIF
jgi:hypothetical protein